MSADESRATSRDEVEAEDAAVSESESESKSKTKSESGEKKSKGNKKKSKAKPGTVRAKLEGLLEEYGMVAIVVYFSIFFSVWAGFALAIATGVSVELGDGEVGAGTFGVIGAAYIPTKLTQPLRIGATLLLTPFVASMLKRLRLRKG